MKTNGGMTRLEKARVDALLTIDELASQTGVPARTIQNIESGRVTRPRIGTLKLLATFLRDVPASEMADRVEQVAA